MKILRLHLVARERDQHVGRRLPHARKREPELGVHAIAVGVVEVLFEPKMSISSSSSF